MLYDSLYDIFERYDKLDLFDIPDILQTKPTVRALNLSLNTVLKVIMMSSQHGLRLSE